jgi:hypothetical protein
MMVCRYLPAVAALACMVTGCRSASVHLYTLLDSPIVPSSSSSQSPAQERLALGTVRIPRAMDRKELVVRKSSGELAILENDNWAAPLGDETRRALASDLRRALRAQAQDLPPQPPGTVAVDIRRWEVIEGRVYLEVDWRLSREGEALRELRCESNLVASTSGTAFDIVRVDQQLLAQLANAIAHAARLERACSPGVTAP